MKGRLKLVISVAVSVILFSIVTVGQGVTSKPITPDDLSELLEKNEKYSFGRDRYETTKKWRERIVGDSFRSTFCVNLKLKPIFRYSADSEIFTLTRFEENRITFERLLRPINDELDGIIRFDDLVEAFPSDVFNFRMPPDQARDSEADLIANLKGCIVEISSFTGVGSRWLGRITMIAEHIEIVDSKTGVPIGSWSYPNWSSKIAQRR
jgi:hypothetical protein